MVQFEKMLQNLKQIKKNAKEKGIEFPSLAELLFMVCRRVNMGLG